jgi:transketolase
MLAVDAIEEARSGHPGLPLGMADAALVLWDRYLRFDPRDPGWPDRDRFVLSAGHGSMLLYGLLHLWGFDLPIEEIRRFRRLGSRTPGHPEFGLTPGVEATSGPLGQGFGNAVGMALASRMLAARMNRDDFSPVTHRVFALAGDGDLMEGVQSEAASLAGYWKLGNLIVLYDDNCITIEGSTSLTFTEDVGSRFEAYGWRVGRADAHDAESVAGALEQAIAETDAPSLVICRSHIGYGAPRKQDTRDAHGEPLGPDEARATKAAFAWPEEPAFLVPDVVRAHLAARASAKSEARETWERGLTLWRRSHPDLAALWDRHWQQTIPEDLSDRLLASLPEPKEEATRVLGGRVLQAAAKALPFLVGGSADLEPSTKSLIEGAGGVCRRDDGSVDYSGRNLHFGVREHAMGAIMNGLAYHGAFRPYGATFLVFSDYMRPSIRLAALSGLRTLYIFTHDSVLLGEDGPTHQPVEHLASLRAIPDLAVWRPCDGVETAMAWAWALQKAKGPVALALTRQKLPLVHRDADFAPEQVWLGGYAVAGSSEPHPDWVLIATGSEVAPVLAARRILEAHSLRVRVVSMPCPQLFECQPEPYRRSVVPDEGTRIAVIEAGKSDGWFKFVGRSGLVIGQETFGQSAPCGDLAERFGFTAERIATRILEAP